MSEKKLFISKNESFDVLEDNKLNTFLKLHTSLSLSDDELENLDIKDKKRIYFNLLRKHIFKYFFASKIENIILFLGAGASIGSLENSSKYGSTMSVLQERCTESLDENGIKVENLEKWINFSDNQSSFEDLISQIGLFLKVSNKNGQNYAQIKKAKNIIYEIIIKSVINYKFNSNDLRHLSIINSLNSILDADKKLNIVTTNYDLMVEQAADDGNYLVFDGFNFNRHHSFNVDLFDWNLVKSVPKLVTQERIYNEKVINLLKIHGSVDWKNINGVVVRDDTFENSLKDDMKNEDYPVMIFPSSNKYMQSYENPYFELFSKFQELLRQDNTLLITAGFSFSDNHISRMILEALKNNNSLRCLVTDHDIDKKDNKSWNDLIDIAHASNLVGILKADMNDKEYGLEFFLKEHNEYYR